MCMVTTILTRTLASYSRDGAQQHTDDHEAVAQHLCQQVIIAGIEELLPTLAFSRDSSPRWPDR